MRPNSGFSRAHGVVMGPLVHSRSLWGTSLPCAPAFPADHPDARAHWSRSLGALTGHAHWGTARPGLVGAGYRHGNGAAHFVARREGFRGGGKLERRGRTAASIPPATTTRDDRIPRVVNRDATKDAPRILSSAAKAFAAGEKLGGGSRGWGRVRVGAGPREPRGQAPTPGMDHGATGRRRARRPRRRRSRPGAVRSTR